MTRTINLFGHKRILDLGCGTGLFYEFIRDTATKENRQKTIPEYYGIDFSEKMASEAIAKKIPNIVIGTIDDLPWPDQYFDAIYSFTVIGLGENSEEKIYRECNRVLVPGGIIVITMLNTLYSPSQKKTLSQTGFTMINSYPNCGQDHGISAIKEKHSVRN